MFPRHEAVRSAPAQVFLPLETMIVLLSMRHQLPIPLLEPCTDLVPQAMAAGELA